VSEIYQKAYNSNLDMEMHNKKKEKEMDLLKKSCDKKPQNFDLIQELLTLQKNKSLLNRKRGLKDDIETRIEEYIKREQQDAN
jgi:DNA sulfur modification protein DndC